MRIKNISCTQFAGIRDKSISLENGINVIYGKNESGKSTLVNLLARTLFQNVKIDARSDKDFLSLYFPGARKGGGPAGDFADGKVSFETENGVYILSKEWGGDARCTLSTPDGIIRDRGTIDALLKEVLVYDEGVYTDMLLTSQKNSDDTLKALLDASRKTEAKQEMTAALTTAFAESGGISIEAIAQGIEEKIKEIAGAHWDFDRAVPMRKNGRWASGLGKILKAYYEKEDAAAVLDEISQLEAVADKSAAEYSEKDAAVKRAETEYDKFHAFAARLTVQNERRQRIRTLEAELRKDTAVLEEWPKMADMLRQAQSLQAESLNRETLDKYSVCGNLAEEILAYEENLKTIPCPAQEELALLKAALNDITKLENQLCGMNLAARIKMLNGGAVEVRSRRTGELLNISGEEFSVTEAVSVVVPEVMELTLSPDGTDLDAVSERLTQKKAAAAEIYKKYQAESPEQIEALVKNHTEQKNQLDNKNIQLSAFLGNMTFAELKTAAENITGEVREKDVIENDIRNICGGADTARFITEKETLIHKNESDYGSMDALKTKVLNLSAELEKARSSVSGEEDIPPEYLQISEPETHLEALHRAVKSKQQERETALTAKTAAFSRLEAFQDSLDGNPAEHLENAERNFQEQKELLAHWKNIEKIFYRKKEELSDNPMQDIADGFTRYLSIISGGKVSSEFPESDKLNMNIYSDNRVLDYGKLSEGTKETVALAFRLAALDHLFPNGGGIAVFDDPFTDMDAERGAQACMLVKDFAARHQVIFLTCKEEYLPLLGGHVIRMDEV